MEGRGEWGSRAGFILAAIGSAIGLGNIWRFPYTAASNGGGAFMIPYIIALLTAGIPIMVLEFGLGHRMRSAAPGIFRKLSKRWEWLGWTQCAIAFVVAVYYTVIIGWAVSYIGFSAGLSWGEDTGTFFLNEYLGLTDSPFNLGSVQVNVLIPVVFVWLVNCLVLVKGVKSGIERANKIFMPLLIICILVITVRGITLPGAAAGLEYLFQPDFSQLLRGQVWIAAYGQLFFSLSIAFAIMLAYSSYLPKKTDIVNNAFITAFGNCGFSLLAGFAVFSTLGFMAANQGVSVEEVSSAGVGLAFIVFPQIINTLPGFNAPFGILFFSCLLFAGLSSSMSIIEAFASGIIDKFNIPRKKVIIGSCIVGLCGSTVIATGGGLYILDIADHYINNFAIVISGLLEVVLIAWILKKSAALKNYVNPVSDFSIGGYWDFCIKIFTPIFLTVMLIFKTYEDFTVLYEGYPAAAQIAYGILAVVFVFIAGFVVAGIKGSGEFNQLTQKEEW